MDKKEKLENIQNVRSYLVKATAFLPWVDGNSYRAGFNDSLANSSLGHANIRAKIRSAVNSCSRCSE